ncbi:MAG TPA: hypothetical protein VLB68_18110, partial [Pyrinomonadaceae bacterium]|nr:hypothetical protein [Pyrinomonadaceae bacterium]
MSAAGLVLLVIGLLAAKNDIAQARGLDRIVALTYLCFAIPLAVFGAEHFSLGNSMIGLVPSYMPWRSFWIYFVGVALIIASLSIATRIQVRWSGLLFGIMMFLFVAMIHFPGAVKTGDRIIWTIVIREMSFAGGGWVLAGIALGRLRGKGNSLITVGRVLIAIAAIFFGVQHFLHPLGVPGVPLAKQMPTWIPARAVIDYLTGAFLIVGGVCFLLARKTRVAATYLGTWILLLVVAYYGPMLIGALANPSTAAKIEGLNYFAYTLLFGATILSLALATTASTERMIESSAG